MPLLSLAPQRPPHGTLAGNGLKRSPNLWPGVPELPLMRVPQPEKAGPLVQTCLQALL